jgi:hypothetical protein
MNKLIVGAIIYGIFASHCTEQKDKSNPRRNYSSIDTTKQNVILNYSDNENKTHDSIRFYRLDSICQSIVRHIYVLYGPDTVLDLNTNKVTTIGETDVRLIDFKFIDKDNRLISVQSFWNDSLPVNSDFYSDITPEMFLTFQINLKKPQLVRAISLSQVKTDIGVIYQIAESNYTKLRLQQYIKSHSEKLHEKFLRVIDSSKVR